jgi:alpha/beta superfamily hydrolase
VIPPRPEPLLIDGPAGTLQIAIEDPSATGAPAARAFAVVCHPHPLHGGTMDNKVVTTLARSFTELGVPTLRFNFRGVGSSTGSFDDGHGETDDALAVVAFGRQRWPDAQLWLGGFSFGGHVALRATRQPGAAGVARLVTVAPAFTRYYATPADVPLPPCPWLLLQGDADEVISAPDVIAWARAMQPPPDLVVLPGVGHFFHGNLNPLRDAVAAWAARQ